MSCNQWFTDLISPQIESNQVKIFGKPFAIKQGILRSLENDYSGQQKQTEDVFGYKWHQTDTFESAPSLSRMRTWLNERYGNPLDVLRQFSEKPILLDAGCGGGMSGLEYWKPYLSNVNYLGVDISSAVDIAKQRFDSAGFHDVAFMQESISSLPFKKPVFDIIFSEGVLHHTDSTEKTFNHLCGQLKPGGYFMFYVYKKKGPVREFTDDLIREKLQGLHPKDAWEKLKALSELGPLFGNLNIEIEIPKDIDLLEIPAGKINLQRFFYWHFFKAFYDPNLTFDEMHHINFDWYAPKNAHRHSVDEVKEWCTNNALTIKHLNTQPSGITVVAQKAKTWT